MTRSQAKVILFSVWLIFYTAFTIVWIGVLLIIFGPIVDPLMSYSLFVFFIGYGVYDSWREANSAHSEKLIDKLMEKK